VETRIQNLEENIAYNRKTLNEETLLREQAHEAYEALVAEYNDATDSVDEALNLLNSLGNPSLIQLKKFQSYIQKVQKKKVWNRIKSGPMITALLSLASSQNFSDQGLLSEIVNNL
jgi:dihydroxyacetone kinase